MYILLCIQIIFFKYVVSNILFDPNNSINTLLRIEVNFNIGSTIYIISFRLNNLVLIFIPEKLLMKYYDKISSTSFRICPKKERFDHLSNICFSLIPYLAIIIIRMKDLNYLL